MSRRKYHQEKRATSAEATRLRIVEATLSLHREQGVAATSMKDIAARADVGIGTVYHHFPTYEEVVRACGERVFAIARPPSSEIFADIGPLDQRVARLVRELFAHHERFPGFDRARSEGHTLPVVAEGVVRFEQAIAALVREALHPVSAHPAHEAAVRTTLALTDVAVYLSLTASGLSTRAAADQITEVLLVWLTAVLGGMPS